MKYSITITRTSYASKTFNVEADNEKEAKEKALNEAYNTSFQEDNADYDVDNVRKED